jgi:hypothetical protein
LVLTVTGAASYLEVRAGAAVVLPGAVYPHGRRFAFDQGTLTVTVGDAGAVRLEAFRTVRAPAGRPGQVLRFTVVRGVGVR